MSNYWIRTNGQNALRENIRQAAKDAGITQRDLASRVGLTTNQLTARLGNNAWWSREEVDRVATVLEMSADELTGDSVFQGDPRCAEFDRPAGTRRSKPLPADPGDRRRALCCECGSLRMISQRGPTNGEDFKYPRSGRFLSKLKCIVCEVVTTHAVLRDHDEHADVAERQMVPDRKAERERDELVARISGFGVDVQYRLIGEHRRKRGKVPPVLLVEYDDSKSQWRIEIHPHFPVDRQARALKEAWKVIALDEREWWRDINPTEGAYISVTEHGWSECTEGLVDEIKQALPVENERHILAIRDEISRGS